MREFPEANWPEWEIERKIGSGSFGSVYSIIRVENDYVYRDALKIVNIPRSPGELAALESGGMDQRSISEYCRSQALKVYNEINTLIRLGGVTNIVNYKDHKMVAQSDGSYRIFIRMELLMSLREYQKDHVMDQETVIRMGTDLARALEYCETQKIIHRDIKPDNIFVSSNGDFKLGDFGTARYMDSMNYGTLAGTYNYMAPEVYSQKPYDLRADLYSLGIVLYQYLNRGLLPFVPQGKPFIDAEDLEQAFRRRIQREPVPDIRGIDPALSAVVTHALEYEPGQRFPSAKEFRRALENPAAWASGNIRAVQYGENMIGNETVVLPANSLPGGSSEKKKSPRLAIIAAVIGGAVLGGLLIGLLFYVSSQKHRDGSASAGSIEAGSSKEEKSGEESIENTSESETPDSSENETDTSKEALPPESKREQGSKESVSDSESEKEPEESENTETEAHEDTDTEAPYIPAVPEKNDVLLLGRFEQDNNTADGAEQIQWRVIDIAGDGHRVLLLSVDSLQNIQFDSENEAQSWRNSSLRRWLNDDFFREAFSAEEKALIEPVSIEDTYLFSDTGTGTDRVFCLRKNDVEILFPDPAERIAKNSDFAQAEMKRKMIPNWFYPNTAEEVESTVAGWESQYGRNCSWWWLRDPAGTGVTAWGKIREEQVDRRDLNSIRPAVWIDWDRVNEENEPARDAG